MSDNYLWDRTGPPDPEIARLEQLLGTLRSTDPVRPTLAGSSAASALPSTSQLESSSWFGDASRRIGESEQEPRRVTRWFMVPLAAAATITLAALGLTWQAGLGVGAGDGGAAGVRVAGGNPNTGQAAGWSVARLEGLPRVQSRAIADSSRLGVGQWLETDAQARAQIDVANVGRVHVDPQTRVKLVSTRSGEYRLQLARGTLHALIWAPPGQFFVETASSTAVDLGCAYTLQVDDTGAGLVRVESGWVGFEWRGREAFIPAGAVCATRPQVGPGTPHYEDVPESVRQALETLDFARATPIERDAALTYVLDHARERDAVTLWHLLSRVEPGGERDRVFDRLSALIPAPEGVTLEGIRAGNRQMLDRWWERLGFGDAAWWRTWKQQWRDQAPMKTAP